MYVYCINELCGCLCELLFCVFMCVRMCVSARARAHVHASVHVYLCTSDSMCEYVTTGGEVPLNSAIHHREISTGELNKTQLNFHDREILVARRVVLN